MISKINNVVDILDINERTVSRSPGMSEIPDQSLTIITILSLTKTLSLSPN